MAKKKRVSFVDRLEHAAGDVVDAVSVAATGSQVGVLELAAEDDIGVRTVRKARKKQAPKKKAAVKKKVVSKKPVKKAKRKAYRR